MRRSHLGPAVPFHRDCARRERECGAVNIDEVPSSMPFHAIEVTGRLELRAGASARCAIRPRPGDRTDSHESVSKSKILQANSSARSGTIL